MASDRPIAFFSYSRSDAEFALRLAQDLRSAGATVWLDQLDIVAGERWDRAVEKALTSCPRLLVILSPDSVESDNVMDEVSFALEQHKLVIPVLHRDCKIPFRLRRVEYIDCRQDYSRALQELSRIIRAEHDDPRPEPPRPDPPERHSGRASTVTISCPGAWIGFDVVHPSVLIDGAVVSEVSIRKGFTFQRELPVGTHELALRMPLFGVTRKYVLPLTEPVQYEVRLSWSRMWNHYAKRCKVLRKDGPPFYVSGNGLLTKWQVILLVIGLLFVIGLLMSTAQMQNPGLGQ